jgi:hypothetical protein
VFDSWNLKKMEILIFVVTFIICFFILYMLSKHDFVLLRQNISLSQIFDAAAISLICAFMMSRVIFVVNNFKTDLLSILKFFHIAKYPGLSLFGFIAGGALCLYLIFMRRKGIGRIVDIFAISFFPLFATSILLEQIKGQYFFIPYVLFVVCLFVFAFFIRSHNKYILRDGSISLVFILLICIQTAFYQYFMGAKNAIFLSFSSLFIVSVVAIPFILFELFLNQRKRKS